MAARRFVIGEAVDHRVGGHEYLPVAGGQQCLRPFAQYMTGFHAAASKLEYKAPAGSTPMSRPSSGHPRYASGGALGVITKV
jgi:hypothetical protein